jgi:microcystin-dependent protein
MRGAQGPKGPPGKNVFSQLSKPFTIPDVNTSPVLMYVTDSSWMIPGLLMYLPGGGTFTVVGAPPDLGHVNVVNSGDPNNAPVGTIINAGTMISPAQMRGPLGPQGPVGPSGPPGPQGASGTSVYTTLKLDFTIPPANTTGLAFVVNASAFGVGQIIYIPSGNYFSVEAVDLANEALTLNNLAYPSSQAPGTVVSAGASVSATGPRGPQGVVGPAGPSGPQGPLGTMPTGVMMPYGAPTAPAGWLVCDGSAVSRTQFASLFSIISTIWGIGDGSSTFNLPDLRGRFPLGSSGPTYPMGQIGGEAAHALLVGELAAHTHPGVDHLHYVPGVDHLHGDDHYHGIAAGQFSHTHTVSARGNATNQVFGSTSPTGNLGFQTITSSAATLPGGSTNYKSQQGFGATTGAADRSLAVMSQGADRDLTTGATGSGAAHNNMPPYAAVQFIIKT